METRAFTKELRILHIEDDIVEARNLVRLFQRLGVQHQLQYAANGEEALKFLKNADVSRPHLILLDLHMPIMDGREFLERLRADAQLCHIAVCIFTSSDLDQDRDFVKRFAVHNFVVKPFLPEDFRAVICDLLAQWEMAEFVA